MPADPTVVIPALLAAAGLSPSEEEVATMIAQYPGRAAEIDLLFGVADARYEEPGLVFSAIV